MSENALRLTDVRMRYKRKEVLKGVTLTVPKGQILGIFGQNGAGKSTLLSVLAGILKLKNGTVSYFDLPLKQCKAQMGNFLAYVPQDTVLYHSLTGLQNLKFWASICNVKKERITELSSALNLSAFINDKVSTYSGGMKRRLNIATSLLAQPNILLLDEPTANLDEHSKELIFDMLRRYKQEGVTILIVSHEMTDLTTVCDKILFLQDGLITEGRPTDEIISTL